MATIRVREDVKKRLEALKRDDETFSELLDRLSRTDKDVTEMAGFLEDFDDGDLEGDISETHDALNESLQSR
jgi:predicted CopG family antitoxin